jgi:hypothetical protein
MPAPANADLGRWLVVSARLPRPHTRDNPSPDRHGVPTITGVVYVVDEDVVAQFPISV